jgi:histone H3/H4
MIECYKCKTKKKKEDLKICKICNNQMCESCVCLCSKCDSIVCNYCKIGENCSACKGVLEVNISKKLSSIYKKPVDYHNYEKKIFDEIRSLQKSCGLLIPVDDFQLVIQEILQGFTDEITFSVDAFEVLQEEAESFLISLFNDTLLEAIHAGRDIIYPKDMSLALRIRSDEVMRRVPNFQSAPYPEDFIEEKDEEIEVGNESLNLIEEEEIVSDEISEFSSGKLSSKVVEQIQRLGVTPKLDIVKRRTYMNNSEFIPIAIQAFCDTFISHDRGDFSSPSLGIECIEFGSEFGLDLEEFATFKALNSGDILIGDGDYLIVANLNDKNDDFSVKLVETEDSVAVGPFKISEFLKTVETINLHEKIENSTEDENEDILDILQREVINPSKEANETPIHLWKFEDVLEWISTCISENEVSEEVETEILKAITELKVNGLLLLLLNSSDLLGMSKDSISFLFDQMEELKKSQKKEFYQRRERESMEEKLIEIEDEINDLESNQSSEGEETQRESDESDEETIEYFDQEDNHYQALRNSESLKRKRDEYESEEEEEESLQIMIESWNGYHPDGFHRYQEPDVNFMGVCNDVATANKKIWEIFYNQNPWGLGYHELKDMTQKKDSHGILKMEFVAGDGAVWRVYGKVPEYQRRFAKQIKRF